MRFLPETRVLKDLFDDRTLVGEAEVRVHLGAVEDSLGIFPVGHLLLREGGTEDILG